MKIGFIVGGMAFTAARLYAQAPAAAPLPTPIPYAPAASMSVSAHEIGTGKGIDTNWSSDYGSFNQDSYRTKGLEVEVRNISKLAGGELKVTVCWTAKPLAGSQPGKARAIFIQHAETLPASITAVSSSKLRFWSPILASNVTNYNALGQITAEGSKFDGWFVIVSRDDVVINSAASTPTYQDLVKDPAKLQPLLAAYKPDGKSATSEMPHWRTDPARADWRARSSTPLPTRFVSP